MGFTTISLGDAGVLAPGRWRWLRALGWMVVLVVLAALAFNGGAWVEVHLVPPSAGEPPPLVLGGIASFLIYALAVRLAERRRPGELALRPALPELAVGLLIGAGMFTLVFAIIRLTGAYTLAAADWRDWGHDLLFWPARASIEELVLRLIVFRLLMRAFGVLPALTVSALIFGLLHLANPNASVVAGLAIAIEAGLMLAAFYLLTGRIWMAFGVHTAWNLFQGSIFGARVSGFTERGSLFTSAPVPGSPDWLTGGPFGPEASLPAVIVGSAIFVLVFTRWRMRERQRSMAEGNDHGGIDNRPDHVGAGVAPVRDDLV